MWWDISAFSPWGGVDGQRMGPVDQLQFQASAFGKGRWPDAADGAGNRSTRGNIKQASG